MCINVPSVEIDATTQTRSASALHKAPMFKLMKIALLIYTEIFRLEELSVIGSFFRKHTKSFFQGIKV